MPLSHLRPISTKLKAGYAVAEIGITAVQLFSQIYLLKYYTEIIGLQASLAGLALSLSVVWDAVSDPLMGSISDRTRSRWGRRRPYLFLGGIFLSLSVLVLFSPPQLDSQTGKFLYLLFAYVLVNTAMTVLSVPHIALGGELTFLRDDRTSVFGWRLFFSNLGMVVGMVVPALVLSSYGDESNPQNVQTSRVVGAQIVSVTIFATSMISFFVTKNAVSTKSLETTKESPFFTSFLSVLRNKAFLPLFFAFVIATIGRTFNSAIALYYYEYRLLLKESIVVTAILLPFFFFLILSIPLWVRLSGSFGKKIPAFWGIFGLGVLTMIAYPLFPPGEVYPPLLVAFFGGIFAGSILILDSILTDVVDYDELKSKEHREGLYFGFWKMGTKLSQAVGIALTGFLLDAIGFQAGASTQSPEIGLRLALIFGPGVGFFFVLGSLVFLFFPLTDEKHLRVQKILLRRKKKRKELE